MFDLGFAVADNIIAPRYTRVPERVTTDPAVVKIRGSPRSFGTYYFSIAKRGRQIAERAKDITPENEKADRR